MRMIAGRAWLLVFYRLTNGRTATMPFMASSVTIQTINISASAIAAFSFAATSHASAF
jgi:hypothetical protein